MATPYQPRATTGLPLANPYPSQPIAYAAQPMTSYAGQPMTSYAGQPMTSYAASNDDIYCDSIYQSTTRPK